MSYGESSAAPRSHEGHDQTVVPFAAAYVTYYVLLYSQLEPESNRDIGNENIQVVDAGHPGVTRS